MVLFMFGRTTLKAVVRSNWMGVEKSLGRKQGDVMGAWVEAGYPRKVQLGEELKRAVMWGTDTPILLFFSVKPLKQLPIQPSCDLNSDDLTSHGAGM